MLTDWELKERSSSHYDNSILMDEFLPCTAPEHVKETTIASTVYIQLTCNNIIGRQSGYLYYLCLVMRSGLLLYSLVKNVAMIQVSYIPGCYGSGRDIKI